MIEYYGWANIVNGADKSSDFDPLKVCKEVQDITERIKFESRILELKWMNSNCILCTAGSTNHKTKDVVDIIELFERISKLSPTAYGLLYVYDDEAKEGTSEEFEIYRIAKGKLEVREDHLLSPYSITTGEWED